MSAHAPPNGYRETTRTRTKSDPIPDQPETTISRLSEEEIRTYVEEARARLTVRGGQR